MVVGDGDHDANDDGVDGDGCDDADVIEMMVHNDDDKTHDPR